MIRHRDPAFEAMIFNLINKQVCNGGFEDHSPEFFCGTLFINADQEDAEAILEKLVEYMGEDHVKMSKIGTHKDWEYAYDFI